MKSKKSSLFHIHEGISFKYFGSSMSVYIAVYQNLCVTTKYNASSKHFLLFSVRMESNETVIP